MRRTVRWRVRGDFFKTYPSIFTTCAYSWPSSLKVSSRFSLSFSFFPRLRFFPPFPLFLGILCYCWKFSFLVQVVSGGSGGGGGCCGGSVVVLLCDRWMETIERGARRRRQRGSLCWRGRFYGRLWAAATKNAVVHGKRGAQPATGFCSQ